MKEQIIIEILHHLPSYVAEQLAEIKEAIRIVLCKYDVTAKETAVAPLAGAWIEIPSDKVIYA